jgi:RNA-splicing ligase RtcB
VCVELDTNDADPRLWVMLHSGSRGIGNRIGTFFIRRAQAACKQSGVVLPDPELGFLMTDSALAEDYLEYARWAQRYACQSRLRMFAHVLDALGGVRANDAELVHCHHKYIASEEHFDKPGLLTRNGAVNAEAGVKGIIPGSMGVRSYLTRGLGHPDALRTSSHGAGRVMSRNVARKTISMAQQMAALEGVECRFDADVARVARRRRSSTRAVAEPAHRRGCSLPAQGGSIFSATPGSVSKRHDSVVWARRPHPPCDLVDTDDCRSQGPADVLHLCYLAEQLRGEREGRPLGGGDLPAGRRLVSQ